METAEPDDGRAAVTPKDTASARVVIIIAEISRGMLSDVCAWVRAGISWEVGRGNMWFDERNLPLTFRIKLAEDYPNRQLSRRRQEKSSALSPPPVIERSRR